MSNKSKRIQKVTAVVLPAAMLFVVILWVNNDIGIPGSRIESDILTSQKIDDGWLITGEVSVSMAAYIAYPEDRSDHTFSVYLKHPGLSFGYFFRCGGGLITTADFIAEFTLDGYTESAFLSMNQQNVCRLVIDDGNTPQEIALDSGRPFAIVLPVNAGIITFYDTDGNAVDVQECPL